MTENDYVDQTEDYIPEGWTSAPTVQDLQQNYNDSKSYHDMHESNRVEALDQLNITGHVKPKKRDGYSQVQPQLIRKHAEWRYAALSEAFLATEDMYSLKPRSANDKETAKQNEQVINYQWNNQIDKTLFVDTLVRTLVDEGTAFVRTGWETESQEYVKEVPIYDYFPAQTQEQVLELQQAAMLQQKDPYAFKQHVPEHIQQALVLTEQSGQPIYPVLKEVQKVEDELLLKNQPTVEVCNSANCYPDPTCNGDLNKAEFFIYSFETSKSALKKQGNYFNLDNIQMSTTSVLSAPDHEVSGDESFSFKDDARQKFVAYEYWGYWDVDGSGITTPIVATWVGSTLIRLEENPYPDKKIPFTSAQYLPVRNEVYGQPDGFLLKDNQAIVGAVMRGAIDLLARSANSQEGIRQDALDAVNKRKYKKGENYEFNPAVDPRQAIINHTYPEIPNSVGLMLNMQEVDANNLTGVRPFGATDSSAGTATADRGVLDAATKRETGILRRLAKLMTDIGKKIIAMNGEFLSDEEIIRVTDDEFVAIRRDDLAGHYDISVTIATAEEDNTKAQELAFMLQTMGNSLPLELSQIVLSDIARLRKMPNLAQRIQDYRPEPDPVQQQMQQLEMQKLQLENMKLQAEVGKLQTGAQLDMAKAAETGAKASNIQSDTDQKDLDFLEQQSGLQHARNVQQDRAQAEGNMALEILKADLNPPKQVS